MDQTLWSARGIAEHAYCPRLFYYMAVEGVFVPSADTEQGRGVHRRVDRPSEAPPKAASCTSKGDQEESGGDQQPHVGRASVGTGRTVKLEEADVDPDRPAIARSLALSSHALGVTATLDLAEIDGRTAMPVEYRKGRSKSITRAAEPTDDMIEQPQPNPSRQPWPTDRVQVGLQVLLLEEAGYTVPEAVLYYAAEKLRLPVVVDDALRQDALAELRAAKRTAAGPRPAPLVNDPRCPRCSLHTICLPDEIHYVQQVARTADDATSIPVPVPSPRKLWPPRDEGIHVVMQREGVRVGVRGQCVRVTGKDGNRVRDFPLANVESLSVLGGVQVSTQALAVFAAHEVPVAFLSATGRLTAMMDPLGPTSAAVRAAQVRVLDQQPRALELARAVVRAKIGNQRTLLTRNHENLTRRVAADLQCCVVAAERATTMDELRGHEGNAAAIYFRYFGGTFKETARNVAARFEASGRKRRPPPDPVNAVLSFGYSMLTNECTAACRLASLEPTLGALHATRPGRPAMSLDLMEPFRPLIADSVAISAFNRRELTEGHFLDTAAGCALTDAGRKAFFSAYGRRMDTEVTHPVFGYRLSYRRMLMLHARLIAAWLLGEVPNLAFVTTR